MKLEAKEHQLWQFCRAAPGFAAEIKKCLPLMNFGAVSPTHNDVTRQL
jgi:hypothetical protein